MAAIIFPLAPAVNQQYTAGGRTYTFTGESWSTGVSSVPPGVGQQVDAPNASGFTTVVAANVGHLILNPLNAFQSGIIRLPPAPTQGQRFLLTSSKSIQGLTLQDSGSVPGNVINHPACIGIGGRLEFIFSTSVSKWVCIDSARGKAFLAPRDTDFLAPINAAGLGLINNADSLTARQGGNGADQLCLLSQVIAPGLAKYVFCWEPIEVQAGGSAGSIPGIGIWIGNSTTGRILWIGSSYLPGTRNGIDLGQYWTSPTVYSSQFAQRINQFPLRSVKIEISPTQWLVSFGNGDGFSWSEPMWAGNLPSDLGGAPDRVGLGFKTYDTGIYTVSQFGCFY